MMEQELYDIYPLWHQPFWQTSAFFWSVSSAIVLIILATIWYLIRRYRNRRKTAKSWVVALAQLQDLKKQGRAHVLHAKQFYFSLTTIIKEYLAARFSVDVKGKTDEELLVFLKTHAVLGSLLIDEIQQIVDGSVFVRFANEAAAQDQIDRDLARARDIITKTIPKEKEQ